MITKDGEEYFSPKDACAVSSFSEDELRSLCLEGRVKSRWVGGGYFVEKKSLLSLLEKKSFLPYASVDLEKSLKVLHRRVFKKFGILTVVVAIFLAVFILPVFFMKSATFTAYDISRAPAAFNSASYMSGEEGTMAAVGYINETIANGIENGVTVVYKFISSLF